MKGGVSLAASVALFLALSSTSIVNGAESNGKPQIGLFPSGNDLDSVLRLIWNVAPVLYTNCGKMADWSIVYSGLTNETSPGTFQCIEGEENCQYLEAMACANSFMINDPEQLLMVGLVGIENVDAIFEQFTPAFYPKMKDCVNSGDGKKLLHVAVNETKQKKLKFTQSDTHVALTINGIQQQSQWAQNFWDFMCHTTKSKFCCAFHHTSTTLPSSYITTGGSAGVLKPRELRGSVAHTQDTESSFFASALLRSSSLLRSPSTESKTTVATVGVYTSGADVLSSSQVLTRLLPVISSPCGYFIDWSIINAGQTWEKSPGNFLCIGGPKSAPKHCKFLESINCLQDIMDTAGFHPLVASAVALRMAVVGRGGINAINKQFPQEFHKPLKKCVDSGKGKNLLSQAIKKTDKDIKWSDQLFPITLTYNGVQAEDDWRENIWDQMCEATKGQKECCPFQEKHDERKLSKSPSPNAHMLLAHT